MKILLPVITLVMVCGVYAAESQAPKYAPEPAVKKETPVKNKSILSSIFASDPNDVREAQLPEPEDPPYYCTVGEEIPLACVRGKTYNRGEIKPTTKIGQIATGLQWLWNIISGIIGK